MSANSHQLKTKPNRQIDPGNLLLVIYLFAMLLFIVLGGLYQVEAAQQVEVPEDRGARTTEDILVEEVKQGELLVIKEKGKFTPAPLLLQKVHIEISGIIARVKLQQQFVNASKEWIEALYVFPLPDESGVDQLRLRVGDRVIEGRVDERKKATAAYKKAKDEGRKTSLLLQNRPNIFTTAVANIGPEETITVEIEYQQLVRYDGNIFSLRFPMVVGPRYIPGAPLKTSSDVEDNTTRYLSFNQTGWAGSTDQVEDASEITPPVDLTGKSRIPVELNIDLAAGFAVSHLQSLYHGITHDRLSDTHYRVQFTGEVVADRDFVLEWQPEDRKKIEAALFTEKIDNHRYMLLMLQVPHQMLRKVVPRELIFILDISGSMAGPSISQAKAAIDLALTRLQPSDRFNVVVYNNSARALYLGAAPATPENIRDAQNFVAGLKAGGGTEMRPGLLLALNGSERSERLRQVVFLTDGAVGNEESLLKLISRRLGDSRLFTVGIGSAPNSYFMNRAATIGRGTYLYIGKNEEVKSKMNEIFKKIENPVVSDLTVKVNGRDTDLESYPSPLPDLYSGEPLLVAFRSQEEVKTIEVSGSLAGRQWQRELACSGLTERLGIGQFWGRKKIRSLMEAEALGAEKNSIKEQVVATALEHRLVSKYTSLIAVDTSISNTGKKVSAVPVKTHLPKGWQANAIFGGQARTGTSAPLRIVAGLGMISCAAAMLRLRKIKSAHRSDG